MEHPNQANRTPLYILPAPAPIPERLHNAPPLLGHLTNDQNNYLPNDPAPLQYPAALSHSSDAESAAVESMASSSASSLRSYPRGVLPDINSEPYGTFCSNSPATESVPDTNSVSYGVCRSSSPTTESMQSPLPDNVSTYSSLSSLQSGQLERFPDAGLTSRGCLRDDAISVSSGSSDHNSPIARRSLSINSLD
jgi:hypothetical protein